MLLNVHIEVPHDVPVEVRKRAGWATSSLQMNIVNVYDHCRANNVQWAKYSNAEVTSL